MGTSASQHDDPAANEYLQRFSSEEHISPNDPFWNGFLSFTITPPSTSADSRVFDSRCASICSRLAANNATSGNLGSLLHVYTSRASELLASTQTDNQMFAWHLHNALFVLRCSTKHILETSSEVELVNQLEARPLHSQGREETRSGLLENFLDTLVEILVDVPLKSFTHALHLEAARCLLVLLSVQLRSERCAAQSCVYRSLMRGRYAIHAPLLVKTLLQHVIDRAKAPPPVAGGGSLVLGLASDIWNMLTFGLGRGSTSDQSDDGVSVKESEAPPPDTPLANQATLLLLVLANHCTGDKSVQNPYREALFSFVNSEDASAPPSHANAVFRLSYGALYATLCATARREHATLLLYLLIHRNEPWRRYVMARPDIERLIVPVLQTLYHAPDSNSHHIYMSLIVLLILSEDDVFNKSVHCTTLKNVAWYTERAVSEISLGGLLVLVVIRTIQYNMLKMRDKYLHTNCLAALANMSGQFRQLHPYVSQRLVSLFETIAKKHSRLEAQLQDEISTCVDLQDEGASDMAQDLAVLQEVLRMVLEILNSCLSRQLAQNPHLVYTLLYKKNVFLPFRTHDAFQDVVLNIDAVIAYFSHKLDDGDHDLSVSEVLTRIQQGALHWPAERLKKFPDLKFKYVEEDQPEDFFIPYVWSLVCRISGLYWRPECIKLFENSPADG